MPMRYLTIPIVSRGNDCIGHRANFLHISHISQSREKGIEHRNIVKGRDYTTYNPAMAPQPGLYHRQKMISTDTYDMIYDEMQD